jgi:hypothetical protein
VSARNNSWSSWKASEPTWLANKDINILVYSGPKPADLNGVPALESLLKNEEDKQVVRIVTAGNGLGHPFAMPPGVPADRVAAIRKAFQDMLRDPEFVQEAEKLKIDIDPVSAESLEAAAMGALNASDNAKKRARAYFTQ